MLAPRSCIHTYAAHHTREHRRTNTLGIQTNRTESHTPLAHARVHPLSHPHAHARVQHAFTLANTHNAIKHTHERGSAEQYGETRDTRTCEKGERERGEGEGKEEREQRAGRGHPHAHAHVQHAFTLANTHEAVMYTHERGRIEQWERREKQEHVRTGRGKGEKEREKKRGKREHKQGPEKRVRRERAGKMRRARRASEGR